MKPNRLRRGKVVGSASTLRYRKTTLSSKVPVNAQVHAKGYMSDASENG